MSGVLHKNRKTGRKPGIDNPRTMSILYTILSSGKYLSTGEIASEIRDYTIKKMSKEYKQIRKLHHSQVFFDIKLKNDAKDSILPYQNKYEKTCVDCEQAEEDYKNGKINKDDVRIKANESLCAKKNLNKAFQRNRIYGPNIRGLLLYLYIEHLLKKETFKNYEKKADRERIHLRKRKSSPRIRDYIRTTTRIHKVISNPLILKVAPFLKDWKYFEEHGFNVIDMLLQIAAELRNQLHIHAEEDNYLFRRATERYFVELENHLYQILDSPLSIYQIEKVGINKYTEILEKRNSYRENIISLQKEWTAKQQRFIDSLKKKCDSFNLEKDLHNLIDTTAEDDIILIDKLAQKYNISNFELPNILVPEYYCYDSHESGSYYKHNDREYLVVDKYMIPKPTAERLKSLLFNGMNFTDACSVFEQHQILNGHSDLIRKFRFDMIMSGSRSSNHYDTFIVEKSISSIARFFLSRCLKVRNIESLLKYIWIFILYDYRSPSDTFFNIPESYSVCAILLTVF